MKAIGDYDFPEDREEAKNWAPTVRRVALHRCVLVVARTRIEGAWKAYCFPVPGQNHANEVYLWEREGSPIYEDYARGIFPEFAEIPHAK